MTKLKYPKNGLYSGVKANTDNSLSMLTKACNACDYSTPSSFKYKNYMNNLSTLLDGYKKEMNNIIAVIKKIDGKYDDLESDLYAKSKTLGNYKVEKRERLVIGD